MKEKASHALDGGCGMLSGPSRFFNFTLIGKGYLPGREYGQERPQETTENAEGKTQAQEGQTAKRKRLRTEAGTCRQTARAFFVYSMAIMVSALFS